MNFTKTLPTRPGAYWWRESEEQKNPDLCKLVQTKYGMVVCMTGQSDYFEIVHLECGEWCELVPRDETVPKGEVEKSYQEGVNDGAEFGKAPLWQDSRAKRVMEGKE